MKKHLFLAPKLEEIEDPFQHIKTLDWRLEAVIQTRAELVKQPEPQILIKMRLTDNEEVLFEADPKMIQDVTCELEQACKLMKGKDARKLQKYL